MNKCENCELFLNLEEDRIQKYKEMCSKNLALHKKVCEQQELINILKGRLLEKRANFLTQYLRECTTLKQTPPDCDLENCLYEKLQEINAFLDAFKCEKESFQREIEENEKYHYENISYLNGLVEYFRESLFTELEKSNKIKKYFSKKLTGLASSSYHFFLDALKEESERINMELRTRYRKTIQKSKDEIERHSQLVLKLRKHNQQLYSVMQKNKRENNEKFAKQTRHIQELKANINKLQEKNGYLHTQIKLQVEGCQNDIHDARKKIRTLIKPKSAS